jgi:hypothetical protein
LTLPASIEHLKYRAFAGCGGLSGKLTTHITGICSFEGCAGLTELDLTNCKVLEQYCFCNCTGLTLLVLPSSLQSIGYRAFGYCTGLTGPLIIPSFVSFIDPDASWECDGMTGVKPSIDEHNERFESWKARGNVLMTLIRFDKEYRREVEDKGHRLHSAVSNAFLANYSFEAQLIYKAAAHIDGTDGLANGICRLICSFLPKQGKYYGTMESNEEVDWRIEEENSRW